MFKVVKKLKEVKRTLKELLNRELKAQQNMMVAPKMMHDKP